jgi:type VI protein secretion system component Hcp
MPVFGKIPGIKGKTKGKYAGWIAFESLQVGPAPRPTGSGTGRLAGLDAPKVSEITVSRKTDDLTNALFRLATSGDSMNVIFELVKEAGRGVYTAYLRLELEGGLIDSFSISPGGFDGPFDMINFSFEKIQMTVVSSATPGAK